MSSSPVRATRRRGLLFIVSAPSGTGKTTLVERLVQVRAGAAHVAVLHVAARRGAGSRTASTIISSAANGSRRWSGERPFLEWADVFGNYYGTSRRGHRSGAGARRGRRAGHRRPGRPAGPDARDRDRRHLRAAAVGRGARAAAARPQQGQRRADSAAARGGAREVDEYSQYEYVVVNDELEAAVGRLRSIVVAERARVKRVREERKPS